MQRRTAHRAPDPAPETRPVMTAATPIDVLQSLIRSTQASLLRASASLTAKPVEYFYSTVLDAFQPKKHLGVFSGDRVPLPSTEGDYSSVAICIRSLLPLAQQSERHILDMSIFSLLTMYLSLLVKDPKLTEMARSAYTSAVREFRLFIGSRFPAELAYPQTGYCQVFLALSTALQLFEYVNDMGATRSGFLTHHEGMLKLLQLSGPEVYQSPYLLQSFSGLRGITIFVALEKRRPTFLSQPAWIYTPFFYRPKTRREILHDIALEIPALLRRTDDLLSSLVQRPDADSIEATLKASDLIQGLMAAQQLVADFARVKSDLETWLYDFEKSHAATPLYWNTDSVMDNTNSYTDPVCIPDLQDPRYQLRFQDGQKAGALICYWSFMLELLMSLIDVQATVSTMAGALEPVACTKDSITAMCKDLDANRSAAGKSAFLIIQSTPYLKCCLEGVFVTQSPLSLVRRYFARQQ
ncbi:uncharacterized protein Z519_08898 [Cladophialophora bantiana CBS 173.52]|uniref:Transcription factor domain-containing protein n=1 Tax=Cladophialophora bantiana (strain ATCC 10958 / CBS 173.52 / CDC B-1940 / NIH 8579) TaxID=1442370 RepID=A0A0D2I042_CLAB1|nr:uncharacterized protein Z519_08898 [Cladophialophora bantiana CBS 173.52]KIW90254.1 hypothetical protein Z519_08898 [Cladophialophora bantiana CBS 173.52]